MSDPAKMTISKLCTSCEDPLRMQQSELPLVQTQVTFSEPRCKQRLCVTKVCVVVPSECSCELSRSLRRAPSFNQSITCYGSQGCSIVLNGRKSLRLLATVKSGSPVSTLDVSGRKPNIRRDFQTQIVSCNAMLKSTGAVG